MKTLFICLSLVLGVMFQANAQTGPTMDFKDLVVDYGVIEMNSDPYRAFDFTNNGDAPLIIKFAKGSCGCTVPEYPKDPILPGDSAQIKVRYDTNRIGKFTKTVSLTTNIQEKNEARELIDKIFVLRIQGDVLQPAPEPVGTPEPAVNPFEK